MARGYGKAKLPRCKRLDTPILRRSYILGTVMAAAGSVLLLRGTPPRYRADPAVWAAEIGQRHGLLIGFGDPRQFHTPPYTAADAPTAGGSVNPAALSDLAPALDGLATSLDLYPPGFVARFCRAIFVCGPLFLDGERAGGTFGPAWIILAADPFVGPGGIRETARLGVHHEFSSIILPRVPGLEARWAETLPPGWQPATGTADALRHAGQREDRDGFLSSYAATSLENDFNTYAETVFGFPARLAALARTSMLVRRKAGLLLDAYVGLDKRLATTFRDLGLGELVP